jgi:hypothetical protein
VRDAGCRKPFGFVPQSVAASVPLTPGEPTTLTLDELPSTDVLVGDATARVAYQPVAEIGLLTPRPVPA